jgi:hypothetical protein
MLRTKISRNKLLVRNGAVNPAEIARFLSQPSAMGPRATYIALKQRLYAGSVRAMALEGMSAGGARIDAAWEQMRHEPAWARLISQPATKNSRG